MPSAPVVEVNSPKGKYSVAVSLSEQTVRYLGRTAELNGQRSFNWTCSGFEFTFTGTAVEATLVGTSPYVDRWDQRPHIVVYVDNDTLPRTDIVLDKITGVYTLAEGLAQGTHTVRVMKASSSTYSGSFSVNGMTLYSNGTPAIGTPPAAPRLQIEFIGDSITCGFGALAPRADSPYNSAEEDGSQAYAYRTAMAFGADANILSIPGYGAYVDNTGNTSNVLPQYYLYDDRRLLTDAGQTSQLEAHKWSFAADPSDAVVIHLGTNDAWPVLDPYNQFLIDGQDTTAEQRLQAFKAAYVAFLKTVRQNNPNAYIFCVLGGMDCGFGGGVNDAVEQYKQETGDQNILFYFFGTGTYSVPDSVRAGHPSAQLQGMIADELVSLIQRTLGWQTT